MKNILVPIGSFKSAVNTLQYAIDFVEGTDAEIYVIKVFGITKVAGSLKKMDLILEEDTNKELDEVLNNVDAKGVKIISKPIKGNIIDSIERVAKQLEVDLIISSARNIATDETVFLGPVSGGLIKHTNIPVLIVPKGYKYKKITKIVMAIKSGVLSSDTVLEPLKDVMKRYKSKLDLIRVITADISPEDSNLNEELKSMISNYKTTENATIFQGVLEHLHEFEPDMLCVIRRTRGFFSRLFEKDVIYKKDFESRIPLLVLKS